jgi:hypothetical protein
MDCIKLAKSSKYSTPNAFAQEKALCTSPKNYCSHEQPRRSRCITSVVECRRGEDTTVDKVEVVRSVVELPVLVLAEKRDSDGWQSLGLEEPQTLLEGVVDVDLSASANNHGTTSTTLC